MADPTWLPDVLRKAGLVCDIYPGAMDRGHGSDMSPTSPREDAVNRPDPDAVPLSKHRRALRAHPDCQHVRFCQPRHCIPGSDRVPDLCDHVRDIVAIGADSEMTRIDAKGHVALVQDVHTYGDRPPVVQLPRHAVSVVLATADSELPVSNPRLAFGSTRSTTPEPALIFGQSGVDSSGYSLGEARRPRALWGRL